MAEKMAISESEVIELLSRIFATADQRLQIGIGDDAAVVAGFAQQILTTDIAVEGVHFKKEWSSAYEIGQRIAAANIADILSMNGQCDYLLVAASLTGDENLQWIGELAQGIADAAQKAGGIVVGGDISRSPTLQFAITAVGHSEKVIARAGAQVGDSIYLSSLTGWSAAGLHLLSYSIEADSDGAQEALREYKAPTLDLDTDFSSANAMADVSDSVLVQINQIAKASGVAAHLLLTEIEKSEEFARLNNLAQEFGVDIWQWILAGGEDHALIATGRDLPGIKIGEVVESEGVEIFDHEGRKKVAPVSWSHFS
jgi:thiamine-monophosphate kinase